MSGRGRPRDMAGPGVDPDPDSALAGSGSQDADPAGPVETPQARLDRARAALAHAEATAADQAEATRAALVRETERPRRRRRPDARPRPAAPPHDGADPNADNPAEQATDAGRRRNRRGSGRGRAREAATSGRSTDAGARPWGTPQRATGDAEPDLSSWPGAGGPAPDWVDADPTDAPEDAEVRGPGDPVDPAPAAAVRSSAGRTRPATAATPTAAPDPDPDVAQAEAEARQIVLRQLAMAPRSRAQLEAKLAAKDIDPDTAAAVLDRFTDVGLVDDEAFAEMLVRSQQETRGLSRRGLRHELRKKGVDPDVAENALADIDVESERARAEELVAGRLRRLHGLPKDVQMRRLAGFLARKGYPGDLAYAVIRDALHNAEEHHRD